jgi:hypothetical protein
MSNITKSLTTNLKWTKEESKLLLSLVNSKLRKKWRKISQIIGTKSAYQCSYKYKKFVKYKKHILYDNDDILMRNTNVSKIIKKLDRKKINPTGKFNKNNKLNFTSDINPQKFEKKLNKSKGITSMSFHFNSSINLPEENFQKDDNSADDSKNIEFLKIFKPNFQNELDYSELWERGIELSDSLKKESSPEETVGN